MKISHKNPKPAIAPYINVISENYFARKPYYSYVVDYQQMVSHRMSVAENQSSNILDLVDDRRPKSRNNFASIIKHPGFGRRPSTKIEEQLCFCISQIQIYDHNKSDFRKRLG
jgi:hypothetical protein